MSSYPDPKPPASNEAEGMESRIRRALGVEKSASSSPPQQRSDRNRDRHRFVQDGEVPVVLVNARRGSGAFTDDRVTALEAALEGERTIRLAAVRSLEDATSANQSLQTKLAHAEIAFKEAIAAEREARLRAEMALREATVAREEAETRLHAATRVQVAMGAAPVVEAPVVDAPVVEAPVAKPQVVTARAKAPPRAKSATKSTGTSEGAEPEPVKWWLPSYRSKGQNRL